MKSPLTSSIVLPTMKSTTVVATSAMHAHKHTHAYTYNNVLTNAHVKSKYWNDAKFVN